ncbi:MAG TPA: hypothetical protein VGF14_00665 [Alphaproteobacteria bacterium]
MMRRPTSPAEGNLSMLEEILGKTALAIASDLRMDVAPAIAANTNSQGRMRDMYANQDFSGKSTIVNSFERQNIFNNNMKMTEPTKLNIFISADPTRSVEQKQDDKPVMSLSQYERDNVVPITGRTAKLGLTG